MSSPLPALTAPHENGRRWRPGGLGRLARRRDLVYVVVDDILENSVSLVLAHWPEIDREGRLHFPGLPLSLGTDRGTLERYLARYRRPREHRDRPLRIGDVFALRLQAGALDQVANELEEQRRLEPFLDPERWIVPPVYDVTADARDEAKVAFYSAVTPALTAEQAHLLRDLQPADAAPPARLASSRRWLQGRGRWLGATTVILVAGLGGMFVLGRVSANPAPPPPPPEQVVTVTSGPGITPSSFASFSFSGASGYECRLDGQGEFASCASPFVRSRLSEGDHIFEVRAQGGTTATAYPWAIVVPPEVTITNARNITRLGSSVTFSFAPTSKGADSFQCRLDDALFSRCSSDASQRYSASQLPAGPHSFEVRTVERSVPGRAAIHTWLVEGAKPLAAPIVQIKSGPGITTLSSAAFTFSGAARYECRLDGNGSFATCPGTFSDLSTGAHLLEVRGLGANDKRGEIVTYPWTIVVPATVTITAAPKPPIFDDASLTFEYTADNESANFLCRFDSDSFVACQSGTSFPALKAGIHSFEVVAVTDGIFSQPAVNTFEVVNHIK